MLAVVCVYWEGSFRGREKIYTPEWVYKLKSMTERNLSMDHSFICFTNVPEKFDKTVKTVKLINNWPGWWSKVEIFKPGAFADFSKVLYLDLDVVVLKDLDSLFNYDNDFAILGTGKGELRYETDGKMTIQRYNSSVMCFTPDTYSVIYTDFSEDVMNRLRGDQDWIGTCFHNLKHFPKGWIVKLRDLKGTNPSEKTKIVMCMDGKNTPLKTKSAAKRYEWIYNVWR